jgi:hypothetical protein
VAAVSMSKQEFGRLEVLLRVRPGAILDNKRLSAMLEQVRASVT